MPPATPSTPTSAPASKSLSPPPQAFVLNGKRLDKSPTTVEEFKKLLDEETR
jgi:hypothetical protein